MDNYYLNIPTHKSLTIIDGSVYINFMNFENISEIIQIKFICTYNFPLNNIPDHIVSLVLYNDYDLELANLPPKLKELILGSKYNKPLIYLPETLEILSIGYSYSHNLLELPSNIKILEVSSRSIRSLIAHGQQLTILNLNFAANLETICYSFLNNLQNTLKEFYLPYICNLSNNIIEEISNFNLLEILSIGGYNNYINKFPKNLKKLILSDDYDFPLDNISKNLEYLEIGSNFSKNLVNLPPKLTYLNLNDNIICNILVVYPISLKELKIIESHPKRQKLLKHIYKTNQTAINIIFTPDYDKREEIIDYYRDF